MIRPRTDADLVSCVVLLRNVHESAGYPVNWPADPKQWLTPPDALGCWVLSADGEVAGHVAVTAVDGRAFVERLFVDPQQGGRGLGRQLLDHAVEVAAAGKLPLELEVADNCEAAIRLYGRAGWKELGRTPIDWGGDQASAVIRFSAPSS
ncbi:GCN5-related N-acetyltransferase [Kribbella flavida DSM 17836]|uniref:GCN5-related N-acetyltransferase n=1 Tax=Kribbella flavida (strain DSM 17836 / JCM 10339 / NBRC 14399) TaxID=479435 RepID=D2Q004_KRIFD|nr:GNAT family N-acetyltransferase [Kribbella flavida]ADB30002.1 GCN5-related N-acetyltransferase [Kribbella flavida DSM 17836]